MNDQQQTPTTADELPQEVIDVHNEAVACATHVKTTVTISTDSEGEISRTETVEQREIVERRVHERQQAARQRQARPKAVDGSTARPAVARPRERRDNGARRGGDSGDSDGLADPADEPPSSRRRRERRCLPLRAPPGDDACPGTVIRRNHAMNTIKITPKRRHPNRAGVRREDRRLPLHEPLAGRDYWNRPPSRNGARR